MIHPKRVARPTQNMPERKTIPFELETVPIRNRETNEIETIWRVSSDHIKEEVAAKTAAEAFRELAEKLEDEEIKLRPEPVFAD